MTNDKPLEKLGYEQCDCSHLNMPCDEYIFEEGKDYEVLRFYYEGFITIEAVAYINGVGTSRIPVPLTPQKVKAIYDEMKNRGWIE